MAKILTGTGKMSSTIKIILYIIFIALLLACTSKTETHSEEIILNTYDKENVFKIIIDHPDVQIYFHPEIEGRTPLKVKSNESLGTDLTLEKFGQPVEFIPFTENASSMPLLEVKLFDSDKDRIAFELYYEVEGVTIKGTAIKNASQWLLSEFEVYEN